MKQDPKPQLSPAGIEANIEHYQALVAKSHDAWEAHLAQLQYWIEQLENVK